MISSSNPNIMCVSLHGPKKAYLYIKNLTDTWYRLVNASAVPSPVPESGTVQVAGLEPGSYNVERWSTRLTDPGLQRLSTETLYVVAPPGSPYGTATIGVSLGVEPGEYDLAIKLKRD